MKLLVLAALAGLSLLPIGNVDAQTFCAGVFGTNSVSYTCRSDTLKNIKYRAKVVCNYHTTVWGPTRTADWYDYGPHSKATCPSGLARTGSGYSWW